MNQFIIPQREGDEKHKRRDGGFQAEGDGGCKNRRARRPDGLVLGIRFFEERGTGRTPLVRAFAAADRLRRQRRIESVRIAGRYGKLEGTLGDFIPQTPSLGMLVRGTCIVASFGRSLQFPIFRLPVSATGGGRLRSPRPLLRFAAALSLYSLTSGWQRRPRRSRPRSCPRRWCWCSPDRRCSRCRRCSRRRQARRPRTGPGSGCPPCQAPARPDS